jgi:hypothetical protein
MQPVESTWSNEIFYINRITDNTVGSEMLKGRWDTLDKGSRFVINQMWSFTNVT